MTIFEVIDLFCGAGGFTLGAEDANVNGLKVANVVACINHDPLAIKSHAANHPNCKHYTEDIRIFDERLLPTKKSCKSRYLLLHASLECTNFSNAKGGKPREADSRTLALELNRYVEWMNPDIITIENVREFLAWGPLDEKGKPISRKNGIDFQRWKRSIEDMGYLYTHKFINSADYGAHTKRVRYFACFVKPGIPVVYPEPTHDEFGRYGLPKWNPVRDKLDFNNEGSSIFDTREARTKKAAYKYLKGKHNGKIMPKFPKKGIVVTLEGVGQELLLKKHHRSFERIIACFCAKHEKSVDDCSYYFQDEYSEKTLERVYQGLLKHVGNGKDDDGFIMKWMGNNQHTGVNNGTSMKSLLGTITTQNRFGVAFITKYYSGKPEHKNISIDGPAATIKCVDNQALVMAYYSNGHNMSSVDAPAPTVRTGDGLALFLMKYYSGGGQIGDLDSPASTILGQDKHRVVSGYFLDKQYSGSRNHCSVDNPCGAITVDQSYGNSSFSLDIPAPTILACRKNHYLINPQYGNKGNSVHEPAPVIIARQDKKPLGMITTVSGEECPVIILYDSDTLAMKKIKLFMAIHSIVDIRMRMLTVMELKTITGFPADYHLAGPMDQQKKFIGNAVTPIFPQRWLESWANTLQYGRN